MGGFPPQSVGANTILTRVNEFLLDQNTKYQTKIIALTVNTAVSIVAEWYKV